ncbi:MAG TPA: hypothetical protein VK876_04425, partial [Rubrivivax sp.]|nr:hypothetical protein [Rubrivivax sp.]
RVAQRYGRGLDIGLRELRAALQDPGSRPQPPIAETAHAPLDMPSAPAALRAAALNEPAP